MNAAIISLVFAIISPVSTWRDLSRSLFVGASSLSCSGLWLALDKIRS